MNSRKIAIKRARRENDNCNIKYYTRNLSETEIPQALLLVSQHLKEAQAGSGVVAAVMRHNPDSFLGVFDRGDTAERMVAVCATLILNPQGLHNLLTDRIDLHSVDLANLTSAGERPAAVYLWSVVSIGMDVSASQIFDAELRRRYSACPIYARPATEIGLKVLLRHGYRPAFPDRGGLGALYIQVDDQQGGCGVNLRSGRQSRCRVVPVSSTREFDQAMAIRALFLYEQDCPYDEEFDGNDHCATHFVGYVDNEPAATLRVRYFAGFAKMERLAVLPRFRRTLIAREIVAAGIDLCRRKGYRTVMGFAQARYVPFWSKFGFKPTARNTQIKFSDYDYVEMYGDLEPDDQAITVNSDPYLLIRPEGYWDQPGVLEKRPAAHIGEVRL